MVYQVGGPALESFVNRRKELALIEEGIDKNNFAIIGLRRSGKTSLMLKAAEKLKRKRIPVYVDVSFVAPLTEKNFLRTLAREVISAYCSETGEKQLAKKFLSFLANTKDYLLDLLKSTHLSIRDTVELWFKSEEKNDLTSLIKAAFELPEKLSKEKNVRFMLIFDEFPRLLEIDNKDFFWAIRSHMHRSKFTHYLISGSSVSSMKYLVSDKKSPFFGTLITLHIEGIDDKGFNRLIGSIRVDGEAKGYLKQITGSFPFYLQAFLYLAQVKKRTKLEKRDIERMIGEVFKVLTPHFEYFFSELRGTKRDIMIEIASKDLNSAEKIAKEIGRANNYVNSYLRRLVNEGFLKKTAKGIYEFSDPFFKLWIKKNAL